MLVRMKTGCVEELADSVGEMFIRQGRADRWPLEKPEPLTATEMAILHAENVAGPGGTAGVEMAVFTTSMEKAILTYTRGPRSARPARP